MTATKLPGTIMTLERKIKIEMEIWCSTPLEFHNLMADLQSADLCHYVNGKDGGYGFEVKTEQFDETTIRKALGFKKSQV
jgi:hypothetical protein